MNRKGKDGVSREAEYQRRKRELQRMCLSAEEYEKKLKELCKKLGV